ncbi:MAG: hypothetical protein PHI72_10260 [Atribacterota bacterium]|jgi:hypothetical protein|nr:hypothetical protein [Atribacterota bacterium]MDD4896498.1 hypothetical protein [Atribacterota bacterium]MDD5638179.1 hypothetical protein [Atribacterota bacterium]
MEMRTIKRQLSGKDEIACSEMIYLRAGRQNNERAEQGLYFSGISPC